MATSHKKTYSIKAQFNGEVFRRRSDDLNELIDRIKPATLLTEMYITIKKGEQISERRLNLRQGRNLFVNPDFRQVFINNLLLT